MTWKLTQESPTPFCFIVHTLQFKYFRFPALRTVRVLTTQSGRVFTRSQSLSFSAAFRAIFTRECSKQDLVLPRKLNQTCSSVYYTTVMYSKLLFQQNNIRRPSVIKDSRRKSLIVMPSPLLQGEVSNRSHRLTQLFLQARISSGMFKNLSYNLRRSN